MVNGVVRAVKTAETGSGLMATVLYGGAASWQECLSSISSMAQSRPLGCPISPCSEQRAVPSPLPFGSHRRAAGRISLPVRCSRNRDHSRRRGHARMGLLPAMWPHVPEPAADLVSLAGNEKAPAGSKRRDVELGPRRDRIRWRQHVGYRRSAPIDRETQSLGRIRVGNFSGRPESS